MPEPSKPKQGVVTLSNHADYELDGNSMWVTVRRQGADQKPSGEKMSVYIHCDPEGHIRIGLYKYQRETDEPIEEIFN